jgi:hypothetical protein
MQPAASSSSTSSSSSSLTLSSGDDTPPAGSSTVDAAESASASRSSSNVPHGMREVRYWHEITRSHWVNRLGNLVLLQPSGQQVQAGDVVCTIRVNLLHVLDATFHTLPALHVCRPAGDCLLVSATIMCCCCTVRLNQPLVSRTQYHNALLTSMFLTPR